MTRRYVALSFSVCALAMSHMLAVQAQTLYKYLDKDGKVVYSDHPPADGKAERIENSPGLNVLPLSGGAASSQSKEIAASSSARLAARIALRDQLRAEVDAAQLSVQVAREALKAGQEPAENERQSTISRPDNGGKPNSNGVITGRGGKVLCTSSKNLDGTDRISCPAISVPNADYLQRIRELELAVDAAEESLRKAEVNFRRNAPD